MIHVDAAKFVLVMWEITVGDLGILQEPVPQTSSVKESWMTQIPMASAFKLTNFASTREWNFKTRDTTQEKLIEIQCREKKNRPAEKEIEDNCSPLLFFEEQLKRV